MLPKVASMFQACFAITFCDLSSTVPMSTLIPVESGASSLGERK